MKMPRPIESPPATQSIQLTVGKVTAFRRYLKEVVEILDADRFHFNERIGNEL